MFSRSRKYSYNTSGLASLKKKGAISATSLSAVALILVRVGRSPSCAGERAAIGVDAFFELRRSQSILRLLDVLVLVLRLRSLF